MSGAVSIDGGLNVLVILAVFDTRIRQGAMPGFWHHAREHAVDEFCYTSQIIELDNGRTHDVRPALRIVVFEVKSLMLPERRALVNALRCG